MASLFSGFEGTLFICKGYAERVRKVLGALPPRSLPSALSHHHQSLSSPDDIFIPDCHPRRNCPAFYDDDDEYTIQYREYLENSSNAITPDLPIEEPDNSLSMGDEHISTILETESDEVIKSSIEGLIPIPSESEGISDDTCDVPFCVNSPLLDVLNDHFEIFSDFNEDCTSNNDDSFEDINYVELSPPIMRARLLLER
ncbi:hypothetical protein Tco_0060414 [Tanacetum coccineum]